MMIRPDNSCCRGGAANSCCAPLIRETRAPSVTGALHDRRELRVERRECGRTNVSETQITSRGVARILCSFTADCVRSLHRASGVNGVARITRDRGGNPNPGDLARLAHVYENSSVRRLGYLLELAGHKRQSEALESFALKPNPSNHWIPQRSRWWRHFVRRGKRMASGCC